MTVIAAPALVFAPQPLLLGRERLALVFPSLLPFVLRELRFDRAHLAFDVATPPVVVALAVLVGPSPLRPWRHRRDAESAHDAHAVEAARVKA